MPTLKKSVADLKNYHDEDLDYSKRVKTVKKHRDLFHGGRSDEDVNAEQALEDAIDSSLKKHKRMSKHNKALMQATALEK